MKVYDVRVTVEVEAENERDAVLGFLTFLDKAEEIEMDVMDTVSLELLGIYVGNLDSPEGGGIECIFWKNPDGTEVHLDKRG